MVTWVNIAFHVFSNTYQNYIESKAYVIYAY